MSVVAAVRPDRLVLRSAAPNPFNAATTVSFYLPEAGRVSLSVFTITGQLVRELMTADGCRPGRTRLPGTERPQAGQRRGSGVYICHLRFDGPTQAGSLVTRMALVR